MRCDMYAPFTCFPVAFLLSSIFFRCSPRIGSCSAWACKNTLKLLLSSVFPLIAMFCFPNRCNSLAICTNTCLLFETCTFLCSSSCRLIGFCLRSKTPMKLFAFWYESKWVEPFAPDCAFGGASCLVHT